MRLRTGQCLANKTLNRHDKQISPNCMHCPATEDLTHFLERPINSLTVDLNRHLIKQLTDDELLNDIVIRIINLKLKI